MDQSTTPRLIKSPNRLNSLNSSMSYTSSAPKTAKQTALAVALLLVAFALALLAPTSALAQEQSPAAGYTIVEIEVVGAKTSSVDLIKSVAGLLPGSTLNSAMVRDAVNRLDGLALFDDIAALIEEVPGGVKLYLKVSERAKLVDLKFAGRDKVGEDDILEALSMAPGSHVMGFTIFNGKQDLLKLYAEKGYYLTEISYLETYNDDSSEVSVVYNITENEKIKIRTVHMSGFVKMDSSKLVGVMNNRKKGFLKSSNYNKSKYQEDLESVVAEYQKNGYIDAYIVSDSTRIDSIANRMDVFVETFEGPRYYFGDVTYTDNDLYTDEMLLQTLKHNPGDIFDQAKYDESLFELYTVYQERGHLHVRILDERKFRDSVIDIEYQIVEGLPSKINIVNITGNFKTKDHVIRRELSALPGQTFHRSVLMRSLRDAMALNYFTNVVPDVKDLPSGDVDIIFEVDEKQTGQLNAGAGYSARDGMVGTFGMGIPNFRGLGQALNFNLEFGGSRNSSQISFTEPWLFGRPTLLGVDVFTTNRNVFDNTYTEGRRGASVRLGRRLRWPDNYFRVSASYRIEGNRFHEFSSSYLEAHTMRLDYRDVTTRINDTLGTNGVRILTNIGDTAVDTTDIPFFAGQTVTSDLIRRHALPGTLVALNEDWNIASALTISISRDSRNLPEFASSGSRFKYGLTKAGGIMGGYWNYTKHSAEFTKFFKIYKGISLAARIQAGAITAPNEQRILESERFSPGGVSYLGIVRGYQDGSLTPDSLFRGANQPDTVIRRHYIDLDTASQRTLVRTDTVINFLDTTITTRVRGNFMLATNWELSVPLATNTLYFLMFFDAGNSWLRWDNIKPFDVWPGAGAGFRLAVPGIGTIGFDFAYNLRKTVPTSPTDDTQGWRTHFQMGTVFR